MKKLFTILMLISSSLTFAQTQEQEPLSDPQQIQEESKNVTFFMEDLDYIESTIINHKAKKHLKREVRLPDLFSYRLDSQKKEIVLYSYSEETQSNFKKITNEIKHHLLFDSVKFEATINPNNHSPRTVIHLIYDKKPFWMKSTKFK